MNILVVILFTLGGLIILYNIIKIILKKIKIKKYVQVMGKIVDIQIEVYIDSDGFESEICTPIAAYTPQSHKIQYVKVLYPYLAENYPLGTSVIVAYDPQNIAKAIIIEKEFRVETLLNRFILSIILIVLAIIVWIFTFH